jgi:colanic acid biosynthesis glycosyl transferase WcaI
VKANLDVLLIAQYFPPDINGNSIRAYNLACSLATQGCSITVLTALPHYPYGYPLEKLKGKFLYEENVQGFRIVRTWVPNLAHWPIIKRIMIHISFIISSTLAIPSIRKTDVIFAMNPSFFTFIPSLACKMFFRKPIVRNVDDLWPEAFYDLNIVRSKVIRKILDSFSSLSYRIAAAIIPVSNGYVQTLIAKYRIPREKIFVIEHGVNTKKFSPQSTTSSVQYKTEKVIMYSGNLNVGYDFEIVFGCAKLLSSEPIRFIIRGTGELSERLEQMVSDYNIGNVEVRTDLLPEDLLVSVLRSADIFLLPMSKLSKSMDEGLPTKILEYQALGKPIVCISEGEAGRYVMRSQCGLASNIRTPEELARLIMILVNDDDLAKKLGRNGIDYVNKHLTLEKVGSRLMEVIRISQKGTG